MSWEQPFKFPPGNHTLPLAPWDALWETSGERTEERESNLWPVMQRRICPHLTGSNVCVSKTSVVVSSDRNDETHPPASQQTGWWFLREVAAALVHWFRSRIKRCSGTFSRSSSLSAAQRRSRLLSAVVLHWWVNPRFSDSAVITPLISRSGSSDKWRKLSI